MESSNAIAVCLWGDEVGYLSWDKQKGRSVFVYDKTFMERGLDISPIDYSIHSPAARMPRYGNTDRLYAGLPPFVADSLPDRWGNRVFDEWCRHKGIQRRDITPLDRLSFIGSRGMGALEYKPAYVRTDISTPLHAEELYRTSIQIQQERDEIQISLDEDLLLEDLYRVGTSAGGRRAKAIVAISDDGELRSGQSTPPNGFTHYILKFNDNTAYPHCEIEYAYYLMATSAGIQMMPSRLIAIGGQYHFLTQRFDRHGNEKMHTLTLAAMNPLANCYEDLFATCRRLRLGNAQMQELFRRTVFNILAQNVDDHTKNFAFIMNREGGWTIAPAYDVTFSVDMDAPAYANRHEMSLCGKVSNITTSDLLLFAKENDIRNAKVIVGQVIEAIHQWPRFADEAIMPSLYRRAIAERML